MLFPSPGWMLFVDTIHTSKLTCWMCKRDLHSLANLCFSEMFLLGVAHEEHGEIEKCNLTFLSSKVELQFISLAILWFISISWQEKQGSTPVKDIFPWSCIKIQWLSWLQTCSGFIITCHANSVVDKSFTTDLVASHFPSQSPPAVIQQKCWVTLRGSRIYIVSFSCF